MRSGPVDSTNDPYYQNYIFDGIEDQFTGIKSSFELKVNDQSVDGISASNAIITLNDLFQSPKVDQSNVDIAGNYTLEGGSGTTNIIFDEMNILEKMILLSRVFLLVEESFLLDLRRDLVINL